MPNIERDIEKVNPQEFKSTASSESERAPLKKEEVLISEEDRQDLEALRELNEELLEKIKNTENPRQKLELQQQRFTVNEERIKLLRRIEQESKGGFEAKLIRKEREEWELILGEEPELIKPLPEALTPEIREKLEAHGFSIHYEPADTKTWYLAKDFPNMRDFGSLSDEEKMDHSIMRRLPQKFLGTLRNGARVFLQTGKSVDDLLVESRQKRKEIISGTAPLDSPGDISESWPLIGRWMTVETLPKPNQGEEYQRTPITDILGIGSRFNLSPERLGDLVEKKESEILEVLGLNKEEAEASLLPAVSYNLFANRFGWGKTSCEEWIGTIGIDASDGSSFTFAMGHSEHGGAGAMVRRGMGEASPDTGFRLAIYFKEESAGEIPVPRVFLLGTDSSSSSRRFPDEIKESLIKNIEKEKIRIENLNKKREWTWHKFKNGL